MIELMRKIQTKYTMPKKKYSTGMQGETNVVFVEGDTKVVSPCCDVTRCTNSWS